MLVPGPSRQEAGHGHAGCGWRWDYHPGCGRGSQDRAAYLGHSSGHGVGQNPVVRRRVAPTRSPEGLFQAVKAPLSSRKISVLLAGGRGPELRCPAWCCFA